MGLNLHFILRNRTCLVAFFLLPILLECKSDVIKVLDPEVNNTSWKLTGLTYVKSAKDIDKGILAIEPKVANLEGEGIYWAYMSGQVYVARDPNVAIHKGVHVNVRYYIYGDNQITIAPLHDDLSGECHVKYTETSVRWQTVNQTISQYQFRLQDTLSYSTTSVFILIENIQLVLTDDVPEFRMPCQIGPVPSTTSATTHSSTHPASSATTHSSTHIATSATTHSSTHPATSATTHSSTHPASIATTHSYTHPATSATTHSSTHPASSATTHSSTHPETSATTSSSSSHKTAVTSTTSTIISTSTNGKSTETHSSSNPSSSASLPSTHPTTSTSSKHTKSSTTKNPVTSISTSAPPPRSSSTLPQSSSTSTSYVSPTTSYISTTTNGPVKPKPHIGLGYQEHILVIVFPLLSLCFLFMAIILVFKRKTRRQENVDDTVKEDLNQTRSSISRMWKTNSSKVSILSFNWRIPRVQLHGNKQFRTSSLTLETLEQFRDNGMLY